MAQEPGEGTPISQSRSLVEDIPSRGPIDRFMAANESGWTSATYNFYRSVLSNFVTAFPVMPTRLDEVIQYVENHRKRKSRYLWNIGTVRSSYKALRTFYSWTKANYSGAELLMVIPPPSNRRIKNFGRKKYRRKKTGIH